MTSLMQGATRVFRADTYEKAQKANSLVEMGVPIHEALRVSGSSTGSLSRYRRDRGLPYLRKGEKGRREREAKHRAAGGQAPSLPGLLEHPPAPVPRCGDGEPPSAAATIFASAGLEITPAKAREMLADIRPPLELSGPTAPAEPAPGGRSDRLERAVQTVERALETQADMLAELVARVDMIARRVDGLLARERR